MTEIDRAAAQGQDPEGAAPATEEVAAPLLRPDHLPDAFWDDGAGRVLTEELARAYVELEQKLASMMPVPAPDAAGAWDQVLGLLGRPPRPEDYRVTPPHPLLEPEPELHARLHAAGFTQKQVELVYELAAERLIPALDAGLEDLEAERSRDRLERHFGSAEAWRATARQIRTWAEASLPPEVTGALSTSCAGVLALHQMMQAAEPALLGVAGETPQALTEEALTEMIRDPRYWRDHDPALAERVSAGFRELFAD